MSARWGPRGPIALSLGVALLLVSPMAQGDHAAGLIEQLRSQLEQLDTALERVAADADSGDLDGSERALGRARDLYGDLRDDVSDLAPHEQKLLDALLAELDSALERENTDDLAALARAARQTLDGVFLAVDRFSRYGTTVEVESAAIASGEAVSVALFIRHVRQGFAGFEMRVRFDPSLVQVEEAKVVTGRGATRVDNETGFADLNGVALETATRRVPPDVLALGTLRLRAVGPTGEEGLLRTEILELVDIEGNRMPALDLDGRVTIR